MTGAPGRIRTHDPVVRSQVLYPTELRARCGADCTCSTHRRPLTCSRRRPAVGRCRQRSRRFTCTRSANPGTAWARDRRRRQSPAAGGDACGVAQRVGDTLLSYGLASGGMPWVIEPTPASRRGTSLRRQTDAAWRADGEWPRTRAAAVRSDPAPSRRLARASIIRLHLDDRFRAPAGPARLPASSIGRDGCAPAVLRGDGK